MKRLQTYLLCLLVAFAPVLQAMAQTGLTLRRGINLRDQEGGLQVIGYLAPGSIIRVPDEFHVQGSAGIDVERTINNWLQGVQLQEFRREGEDRVRRDYFTDVEILSAAPGSRMPRAGQRASLALQYLRRSSGLDTTFTVRDSGADLHPDAVDHSLEARASVADCRCETQPTLQNLHDIVDQAIQQNAWGRRLETRTQTNQNSIESGRLDREITRTCEKSDVEEFFRIMQAEGQSAGVPMEVLRGIIAMESDGDCGVPALAERDRSASVGLFQVNTGSTEIPRCSTAQLTTIRGTPSFAQLQATQGINCLENPFVNMREAIRIFQGKWQALTSGERNDRRYTLPFDEARLRANPRLATTLMISAYNGGQRWALNAHYDLVRYNETHDGPDLDPYNFSDLRIFYFRNYLERDQRQEMTGYRDDGRSTYNTYINLSYTEGLMRTLSQSSQYVRPEEF